MNKHGLSKEHLKFSGLFVLLMMVFLLLFGDRPSSDNLVFFLTLQAVAVLGPIAASIFYRQRLWSPLVFYPVLYSLYFSFGGLGISQFFPEISARSYQMLVLGLLSFQTGALLAIAFFRPSGFVSTGMVVRRLNRSRVILVSLVVGFVSLSIHTYILKSKGLIFLKADFEEVRVTIVEFIGAYLFYIMFATMEVVLLLLVYRITHKKAGMVLWSIIALLSVLPLDVGSRTRILLPFLIAAIFFYLYSGERFKISRVLLVAGAAILFIGAVGAYRLTSIESGSLEELFGLKLLMEFSLGSYTLETIVSRMGHSYIPFHVFFSPLATLLPGKQLVVDYYLKNILNLQFVGGGFTPTIVGGFYVYGGAYAVVIGMGLYGMLLGCLYKIYIYSMRNREYYWPFILLYAYFLSYAILGLKNGFFTSLEPTFHLCVLVMILLLCIRRERNSDLARPRSIFP